jgi:hypothetical protein
MKTFGKSASFALLIFAVVASCGNAREWRDSTGSNPREAEFVAYRSGSVVVRLADGKEISTAFQRFSAADQAYVRSIANVDAKAASVPPASQKVTARTANYQAAVPAQLVAELPAGASAEAKEVMAKYGSKYAFYACCGTFHIILDDGVKPGDIIGTARYSMPCHHNCCGCCYSCCGPSYLSFLRLTTINYSFIEATDVGTSKIKHWRFWWVPNCCKYKITYSEDGTNWYVYGHADRSTPK